MDVTIYLQDDTTQIIQTSDEFTYDESIDFCHRYQSKDKIKYLRQPLFLDTETSWNHDENNPIGWIYQWCLEFNNQILIGQNPFDLVAHIQTIIDLYQLNDNYRAVIFVHNLSYDITYLWQFMAGVFGNPEYLAIRPHKLLSVRFDGIEFRCSYLLSNMGLETWGKKLKCNVQKLVGAIDYELIHYQDEILSSIDWSYMIQDVLSMKECVFREMLIAHDTIATIPLTSTGYVRRDCRRACVKDKTYRKWFLDTRMDVNLYKVARAAFMGGLSHGNRFYGGKTIDDVGHDDKKSYYPSKQELELFPDKFYHLFNYTIDGILSDADFNFYCKYYHCLMVIAFKNLKLKRVVTCPCVSKSKIMNFWEIDFRNDWGLIGTDNGKVINAYGDILITCTELDYYWIKDQYKSDGYFVLDLYYADKIKIKQPILNVVNSYFQMKESLDNGVFRDKSKNKLNGIYGMSATDPVRSTITFNFDSYEWKETKKLEDDIIQEKLDKYYKSRNSFNNYTHGIFTTAFARYGLLFIIKNIIGYENFLYCDTDSVFYKNSPEIQQRIKDYNQEIIDKNINMGLGVKNKKGTMSYYDVLESEDHIKKFRFLHSKCYAYVTDDDKLHVTIAGVTKDNKRPRDDPEYITSADELGSIENLCDGFIFRECGGTKSKYINSPVTYTNINGHDIVYASACIITKTTKELGGCVEGLEEYEML